MAKRAWAPAINTFLSATKNNYHKAHKISGHLDAILFGEQADPVIAALYAYYHPIYIAFDDAFIAWTTEQGVKKGSTVSVKLLLKEMTTHINDWAIKIQSAGILKGSADYLVLFPHGHYPYQNGRIFNRIYTVELLNLQLANYPTLAAVKTLVDNYWQQLHDAWASQTGIKGNAQSDSHQVEAQRKLICRAQYYVLGGLMQIHVDKPSNIERYFLVNEIRNGKQTHFTGRVKANSHHVVAQRSLKATQMIRLQNVGLTPLDFYFAENKFGAPVGNIISLQPDDDKKYTFADFAAPKGKLLLVRNQQAAVDGHFEIVIQ